MSNNNISGTWVGVTGTKLIISNAGSEITGTITPSHGTVQKVVGVFEDGALSFSHIFKNESGDSGVVSYTGLCVDDKLRTQFTIVNERSKAYQKTAPAFFTAIETFERA